jgi:hypothetical protein
MQEVRDGHEVVIEAGKHPIAIMRPAEPLRGRLLSESIALAEARIKERGYELVLDEDFAADVNERITNRNPRDTSAWG